jgi:hypothetical protein
MVKKEPNHQNFNSFPAESDSRQKRRRVVKQTFYSLRNQIQTYKKLNLSRQRIGKKQDEEQSTHGIRKLGHVRGAIKSGLLWPGIRW